MINVGHSSVLNHSTFISIVIAYFICAYLFIWHTEIYFFLGFGEMAFVELFGAFCLLLVSFVLICSVVKINKKIINELRLQRFLLVSASILFFLASGEELSWGQHIFSTVTPEWLKAINDQDETNIHNINKSFYDRALMSGTILVTLITAVFHYRGQSVLFGFKLPEYPLVLAFMLLPFYGNFETLESRTWALTLIPFVVYMVLAIRDKNQTMLVLLTSFAVTGIFMIYIHHQYFHLNGASRNIYHEYRETFFSILCVIYAIQIYRQFAAVEPVVTEDSQSV